MVVYSAMHARLHNSMARVLSILHRLNGSYMDDAKEVEELGEEIAKRADFEGPMDVVPVSDPNIFSESQRFAQVQAVAQRAAALPQIYNARKVEERILETLKVPNAKDLLNPALEPQNQNAVQENVVATMGKPVIAFPEQDHIAHLKTHLAYMTNPALGMSQLIAPTYLPVMIGHLKEHIAMWYAAETTELADAAAGSSVSEALQKMKDPKERQAVDRMLAEASQNVVLQAEGIFDMLPPVIKAATELMKQFAPQPPMDPAAQAAAAETQRRQAADQAKMQLDGQRMQLAAQQAQSDAQAAQAQAQLDAQRLQIEGQKLQMGAQSDAQRLQADLAMAQQHEQNENQRTQMQVEARNTQNEADNLVALKLAELEITSGEKFGVTTGTGINPGP